MLSQSLDRKLIAAAHTENIMSHCVGIFLPRNMTILLLKRRYDDYMPNLWEIPGGHLDAGESIADALVRELYEETHYELTEIGRYCGYYDYPGEFGPTREWNFEVTVKSTEDLSHPEHSESLWADAMTSRQLPMAPHMAQCLLRYWSEAQD